ncbi:LacI family DNA-binding transcriptional regulator [Angustibacter luteus]|uniref:LacI family DNA-binding transcriptional regulator n=1 Tax=Angustibacter luteus TaxID=658456 RepID=A0ABW1JDF8_9ACTN
MSASDTSPRRGGRIGVRDVAQLAGVSTQTVSRVLNNSPNLREETRARVLEAMAELDYRPNNAARALGTATTRTLGVVATDVTLHGPALAVAALATAARDAGRWIATAYADATDEASVDSALSHVLGQGVDGIVLVAPHVRTRDALLNHASGTPMVVMHGGPVDRQAEGTALVVDHLVSLGHRRIGRVGGPADWLEERSRRAGHDAALATHGLAAGPSWGGDWSAAAGHRLSTQVADVVRSPNGPTAVVVANDQMALGLMAGLRAGGVDVPGQVSVVGFDDNPDAAYYSPPLTTVRLDVGAEARRCVAQVFGDAPPDEGTAPRLVARSSTAAPA